LIGQFLGDVSIEIMKAQTNMKCPDVACDYALLKTALQVVKTKDIYHIIRLHCYQKNNTIKILPASEYADISLSTTIFVTELIIAKLPRHS